MSDREVIDLDSGFTNGNDTLPNSTAVLVLGIISIATCWFYGIPGLVCGIISLVLFKKDNSLYKSNPSKYSVSSYKNLKAGQVCGIIGLSLSGLFVLYIIVAFLFIGGIVTSAAASGAFDQ